MTIQRLSAESVKIQLSAAELKPVLEDAAGNADSPQMLRLISALLRKAEEMFAIPFSAHPVTVELLAAPDGGLEVYLTMQRPLPERPPSGTIRLSARFRERDTLRRCCIHLMQGGGITQSMLYRHADCYVLSLRVKRGNAARIRHILTEFGMLYPLSAVNRARLAEFGRVLVQQDAVSGCAAGKF